MKSSYLLIAALLVVSLTSFFVTSWDYDGQFDDLRYQIVFSDAYAQEDSDNIEVAHTFGDVLRSQTWHYMHENGRMPVHILVQLFICVFPWIVYPIANTICWLIAITLITRYIFPPCGSKWALMYVVFGMTYMFPRCMMDSVPWFTADLSLNYLWPATLSMGVILLWNKRGEAPAVKWKLYPLYAILGFFAGWSNEAFSVPLLGALILCVIFNKQKVSGAMLSMMAAMCAGTALLIFSPGTIERASNATHGGASYLLSLILCYQSVKFVWLLLAATLFVTIKIGRRFVCDFYYSNQLCSLILLIGIMFSVVAHSDGQSLTFVELMSMILLARLFIQYAANARFVTSSLPANAIYVLLVVAFAIHQLMICRTNHTQRLQSREVISAYCNGPDGVMCYDMYYTPMNKLVQPFAYNYHAAYGPYMADIFAAVHGQPEKQPLVLSLHDYRNVIEHPDSFFVEANLVPGSAHLYNGDNYFFARLEPGEELNGTIVAHFDNPNFVQNMSFGRRLVYKLLGNKKAPKALDSYVIDTRNGRYLVTGKILSVPSSIEIE